LSRGGVHDGFRVVPLPTQNSPVESITASQEVLPLHQTP
jgi:hypothetical protein